MNDLYPLKFQPVFKEKVWGGQKIRTELGIDFGNLPNCGEMWAISGVEGSQTIIENGFLAENELNELVEIYMGDLVGEKVFKQFGNEFPLLIKFIDANDWLSIQVHPDDELAAKRNIGSGKTEMWYVAGADAGSQLITGYNKPVDEEEYVRNLENKSLKKILNFENVEKGDVFFIPSGRVHALGPGILIAEIQQTSDTTYRIYDWDRPGTDGKLRQLHTEDALEAIDYTFHKEYKTQYKEVLNATTQLVDCPYFTTNLILFDQAVIKNTAGLDSFVIYICLEGKCTIFYENGTDTLKPGEVILVPASVTNFLFETDGQTRLLEIYIS
jgi:mannose-6-phosphate isomerase